MALFHRKTADCDYSGDWSSSFAVEDGNTKDSSGGLCICLCGLSDNIHEFDVEDSPVVPLLQRDKRPLQWWALRIRTDLDNLQHILDIEVLLLHNETAATAGMVTIDR